MSGSTYKFSQGIISQLFGRDKTHSKRATEREDYRERGMQNPAVDTQMRHYIEIILLGWNKSLNGTSREAEPDFSLSEKGEG